MSELLLLPRCSIYEVHTELLHMHSYVCDLFHHAFPMNRNHDLSSSECFQFSSLRRLCRYRSSHPPEHVKPELLSHRYSMYASLFRNYRKEYIYVYALNHHFSPSYHRYVHI